MRLGVPYQGSKNAIAREIVACLPRGKRFVDLFAGGCAMTHAAMLSGKYERFLANDLHGFGVRLFRDAIAGKCNGAWRHWVSREEFMAKRDSDPLVALCWSFSNNGRYYLWGRDIEVAKKRAFDQFLKTGKYNKKTDVEISRVKALGHLQALERLEALERLQALERDYRDVDFHADDVVYADPPYAGTAGYNTAPLDAAAFWDWARSRPFPVFVSEYHAPVDFTPIWCKGKCRLMNQRGSDSKVQERLFVHSRFAERYQTDLFLGMDAHKEIVP